MSIIEHPTHSAHTKSLAPCHENDLNDADAIASNPTFRILTTLQYILFNKTHSSTESVTHEAAVQHQLSNVWERLYLKFLDLHARRLCEAALAFGWIDVAKNLEVASRHDASRQDCDTAMRRFPQDLMSVIEEAANNNFSKLNMTDESIWILSTRVRILVSRTSAITVEFGSPQHFNPLSPELGLQIGSYTSRPFTKANKGRPTSKVRLAPHATIPTLFTRHKTTHRAIYDDVRQQADPPLKPTDLPTTKEVLLFNTQDQIMEASLASVYFLRNGTWITPSIECGGVQSVTRLYALENGWCQEGIVGKSEVKNKEVIWLSNAVRGFFPGVLVLKAPLSRGE